MQRYFGRVWVCKVRDDWCQSAYRGTFPTSGERQNWTAFEVSSFAPTSLELTLLQSEHRARGDRDKDSADLGLAVLRAPRVDQHDWGSATLAASAERKVESSQNCETFLDAPEGGKYLVLPMAFNQFNKGASPTFSVLFHSNQPLVVDKVVGVPPSTVARALYLMASTGTSRKIKRSGLGVAGATLLALNEGGTVLVVENLTNTTVKISVDCNGENIVASRGTMRTEDAVPPMSFQIINILTQAIEGTGYSIQYSMRSSTVPQMFGAAAESHRPLVSQGSIHAVSMMGDGGGSDDGGSGSQRGGGNRPFGFGALAGLF